MVDCTRNLQYHSGYVPGGAPPSPRPSPCNTIERERVLPCVPGRGLRPPLAPPASPISNMVERARVSPCVPGGNAPPSPDLARRARIVPRVPGETICAFGVIGLSNLLSDFCYPAFCLLLILGTLPHPHGRDILEPARPPGPPSNIIVFATSPC